MSANDFRPRPPQVELRTGVPYANLIANQGRFSQAFGKSLDIDPNDVIPMAGTMGAIEAVRNHVLKNTSGREPKVLTVSPGYWRARESFEWMGFPGFPVGDIIKKIYIFFEIKKNNKK